MSRDVRSRRPTNGPNENVPPDGITQRETVGGPGNASCHPRTEKPDHRHQSGPHRTNLCSIYFH